MAKKDWEQDSSKEDFSISLIFPAHSYSKYIARLHHGGSPLLTHYSCGLERILLDHAFVVYDTYHNNISNITS